MKLLALALLGFALFVHPAATGAQSLPRVLIKTEVGEIELEIDSARAPATAANFLRYVDGKFYDGGRFHRTVRADNQPNDSVRIAVIQGAINRERARDGFPAIALERTSVTSVRHVDGAISMARGGPDSATSGFFICVGEQPSLDYGGRRNPDGQGFAAFGKVVRGMDVVKRIHLSGANGQNLTPPVQILEVRRSITQ
jgi:peptidyl-prolyl cis-trans isomerase A (cyclophilin A)